MHPLLEGIYSQILVIHALILRETRTRFGTSTLGYVWALLEPLIWIATFWGMYHLAGRRAPGGLDMVAFLATGIVPYEVFSKTADRCAASVNGNRGLLFYPQVHPLDIVFARAILEAATYAMVLLIILGSNALISGTTLIADPLSVLEGILLASLLGTGLGLCYCSLGVVNTLVDRIRGPLMRPLFWISGLFFTLNDLPLGIRSVFAWNPVLHCVELVRGGIFESYAPRYVDPSYVVAWILALAFVGLTLERSVRHRIEAT